MSRKNKAEKPRKATRAPMGVGTIAFLLGLLACGAVIAGINYHGLTYDEPIYAGFGARSAKWIVTLLISLFDGDFAKQVSAPVINQAWFASIDMQPPLVQVLSGLSQLGPGKVLSGMLSQRLPVALFFGLAIGTLFWFTDYAFNRPAAYFSALGLFLMPRFFAHAHFATLDVPVAALILLTAATFYAASEERSWNLSLFSGLFMGLALLTKLNAGFLIGILLIWAAIFHPPMVLRGLVAFFIISPAVFLAGWPWLWHDTLPHLKQYLFFHLQHYPVLVYYLGELHEYAPWHYPFVMIGVTTPVIFLALMLLGLGYAASGRCAYERKKVRSSIVAVRWLLLMCAVGYLIPSAMPFSPKYNGVRLFLPALPFLMGLAGGGFALVHGALARALERVRALAEMPHFSERLAFLMGLGLLLPAAVGLLNVFPHEQAYYNALVGGPAGAQKRGFETIYWGGVYNAALPALDTHEKQSPQILVTPQGVTSLLIAYQRGGGLRKDLRWTTPPPPKEQATGWPQEALVGVDTVIFQCAQSEFDALSRKLYEQGRPEPTSVYLDGVPLLLIFSGDEARRLFPAAEKTE
ncbi:MAG: hypothetical protein GTO55_05905 [Armatimonadetes bacterium]|nr:hypothetical protein [Armatimonadota bacterium]NIM23788.1 hypothetical protein [Armatimonadota bacterium]NIM67665.1 hypothetical protein [Armatimonadota bacterium]NIM76181.1 hypothetical protein [Armatimonadota bacterium]NIN05866.1 hypothetical protein [Armatimonadota bacterium]